MHLTATCSIIDGTLAALAGPEQGFGGACQRQALSPVAALADGVGCSALPFAD